jgi:Fe-S-cluster containining protein
MSVNSELLSQGHRHLEALQSIFKCQRCGTCCNMGGDMPLGAMDVHKLLNVILSDKVNLPDFPFIEIDKDRHIWKFERSSPCMVFDPLSNQCKAHRYKPEVCKMFPFLSLGDNVHDIITLINCPGARLALAEYFGVLND